MSAKFTAVNFNGFVRPVLLVINLSLFRHCSSSTMDSPKAAFGEAVSAAHRQDRKEHPECYFPYSVDDLMLLVVEETRFLCFHHWEHPGGDDNLLYKKKVARYEYKQRENEIRWLIRRFKAKQVLTRFFTRLRDKLKKRRAV